MGKRETKFKCDEKEWDKILTIFTKKTLNYEAHTGSFDEMNINNRKPYIDSQNTMASNYSGLIQIKMKNKYYQRISESPYTTRLA